MASARGLANHSLYMARLLVSQWRVSLLDQPLMEQALNAAFAPALQLHLLNAYGWFLLACVRVASLPNCPPHDTKGLPALSLGIVEPEEIDECRHLEISGWLAQLQCPIPHGLPPKNHGAILASSGTYPSVGDFEDWMEALDRLIGRMGESLDEN